MFVLLFLFTENIDAFMTIRNNNNVNSHCGDKLLGEGNIAIGVPPSKIFGDMSLTDCGMRDLLMAVFVAG